MARKRLASPWPSPSPAASYEDTNSASSSSSSISSYSSSDEDDLDYDAILPSPSPSPSPPRDAAEDAEASVDSSGSEADVVSGWGRDYNFRGTWPAADDFLILETSVAHLKEHGVMPRYGELFRTLRDRFKRKISGADEIGKRMLDLRYRYEAAADRLATKGVVPAKEKDFQLYKLSKLLWGGTRSGKGTRAKTGPAPNLPHERREFGELAELYPNLAEEVEGLKSGRRWGMALRRGFVRIGDDKAKELELMVKKQRLEECKMRLRTEDVRKKVANKLLKYID